MVFVSLIFWALAAICNAIMDACSHHFWTSVFQHLDQRWWNAEVSWKNKYVNFDPTLGHKKLFPNAKGIIAKINYPVQLTDAWHFFKTCMILLLVGSILSLNIEIKEWTSLLILILAYGIVWNLTFSLFYQKLLKRK